jgi:hypothetical protein
MQMSKRWKIGDRVKVVEALDLAGPRTGTIRFFDKRNGTYAVEIDDLADAPFGGHSCTGHVKNDKGWWVHSDGLVASDENTWGEAT